MIAIIIIGGYFGLGILALLSLDLLTGRIRRRLGEAIADTQDKLAFAGSAVGRKESFVLTIGALWLFWPVAIYASLFSGGKK